MTPTIFIPGITGNTIANTNTVEFHLLYSAVRRYYKDMTRIALEVDEQFDADIDIIAERAHIEKLAYKELDSFICEENGLSLYIFNYDWRRSNGYNGKKLKEFVEYLKGKLRGKAVSGPFNFLTHSMGSFVFRAYLKETNGRYEDINKAVLTVPPNKGAIDPLKMLVVGKSYLINSTDTFRKIARTFPSLYELLPTYDGAFEAPGLPNFDIFEPNSWQSNLYKTESIEEKRMLEKRLIDAKQFITNGMVDLASLPDSIRSKFLIVTGNKEKTLELVKIQTENAEGRSVANYFDFDTLQPNTGDGTVPQASALFYKREIQTLIIDSSIWRGSPVDVVAGQHAFFLTDGRVQAIIKRFFNGERSGKWWDVVGGSTRIA